VPAQPPLEVMYVGGLPVDVGVDEQEVWPPHSTLALLPTARTARASVHSPAHWVVFGCMFHAGGGPGAEAPVSLLPSVH
jgi:hypothetical protein